MDCTDKILRGFLSLSGGGEGWSLGRTLHQPVSSPPCCCPCPPEPAPGSRSAGLPPPQMGISRVLLLSLLSPGRPQLDGTCLTHALYSLSLSTLFPVAPGGPAKCKVLVLGSVSLGLKTRNPSQYFVTHENPGWQFGLPKDNSWTRWPQPALPYETLQSQPSIKMSFY